MNQVFISGFSKPSAESPEEQQWGHSRCCCQHRPQAETQHTDGQKVPEDVTGGEQDLQSDVLGEPAFTAGSAGEPRPESGGGETEGPPKHLDGRIDLGIPEEELTGVLEELELSLRMTSAMEQEKVEHLSRLTETESSGGAVRRRKRRRRVKKESE